MKSRTSYTEENYLKAIFKLSAETKAFISTNAIAAAMLTTAASVTDMLKRLSEKDYISYTKYKGVRLTDKGQKVAKDLIRKHRLWETFLVSKLSLSWSEVHELAEELEHIDSDKMTNNLDEFLGHPKFDPHGDPIPDKNGKLPAMSGMSLADLKQGDTAKIVGVGEESVSFLNFLESTNLVLGSEVKILQLFEFDKSLQIKINQNDETIVSNRVSSNLYVERKNSKN